MKKVLIDKKMETSGNRRRVLLPRRDFFKYLGGGIIVLVTRCKTRPPKESGDQESSSVPEDFNAFLHIGGGRNRNLFYRKN